jgi:hypothetical protein
LLGIWTGFVAEAGDFVGKNPTGKKTIQTKSQTPVSKTKKKKRPQRKKVDLVEVVGRVRSETKAMVDCLVELDSGKYCTRTDSMGIFRIRIPKARMAKAVVSVQVKDFEHWEYELSAFPVDQVMVNLRQIPCKPIERYEIRGGAVTTHYNPPKRVLLWRKVKRFFGWKPKWERAEP